MRLRRRGIKYLPLGFLLGALVSKLILGDLFVYNHHGPHKNRHGQHRLSLRDFNHSENGNLTGSRVLSLSVKKAERRSEDGRRNEMVADLLGSPVSDDSMYHNDDTTIADELYKNVRVLCWVMMSNMTAPIRAMHVNATWGKRCNTLLFAGDNSKISSGLPSVHINDDDHGSRTFQSFDYMYEHYLDDADWFLKTDDSSYFILENLRYFLSGQKPTEPIYFGHHFKPFTKQGYFSGKAGYVISKEALIRFGNRDLDNAAHCHNDSTGSVEDKMFGRCLYSLGVVAGDSRDALNRSRFHCTNPGSFLHDGSWMWNFHYEDYPYWYEAIDLYGVKTNIASMSDYTISFHYVSSDEMYEKEYYVYHLRPHGIHNVLQNLNKNHSAAFVATHSAR